MPSPAPKAIYSSYREDLYIKGPKVAQAILDALESRVEFGRPEYWEIKSICQTHLDEPVLAARSAQTAFNIDNKLPYYILWGTCLLATGDYKQGRKMLEGLAASKAPSEGIYKNLALSYIDHGEFNDALRVVKLGLDINELISHFGVLRLLESIAYHKLEKQNQARSSLEKAISLMLGKDLATVSPDDFEALSVRMMAFWLIRNNAEFFQEYLLTAKTWWAPALSQKETKLDPRILKMRKRALAATTNQPRPPIEFTAEAMAGTVELHHEMAPYRAAAKQRAF